MAEPVPTEEKATVAPEVDDTKKEGDGEGNVESDDDGETLKECRSKRGQTLFCAVSAGQSKPDEPTVGTPLRKACHKRSPIRVFTCRCAKCVASMKAPRITDGCEPHSCTRVKG